MLCLQKSFRRQLFGVSISLKLLSYFRELQTSHLIKINLMNGKKPHLYDNPLVSRFLRCCQQLRVIRNFWTEVSSIEETAAVG